MLFSKEDVEEALRALVEELVSSGVEVTIQVVGGAAIMLQVEREALTSDIDAVHSASFEVKDAVKRIGEARNWPATWLNDEVKMFVSHFDTEADWDLRTSEEGVTVLVARFELLLAMKLYAGRGRRDAVDIDQLLEACAVTSLVAAEEVFDRYYPTEVMSKKAMRQLQARFDRLD